MIERTRDAPSGINEYLDFTIRRDAVGDQIALTFAFLAIAQLHR